MTASLAELALERAAPIDPARRLAVVRDLLVRDALVPYLGPGVLALTGSALPATPEAVAAALHAKAPAPSRVRTNMWSVAQFIESRRHRKTLQKFMAEIFANPVAPSPLVAVSRRSAVAAGRQFLVRRRIRHRAESGGAGRFRRDPGHHARRNQLRHLDARL